MFTGIVEYRGEVLKSSEHAGFTVLSLDVGPLDGVKVGDSVLVSGVCLTAVAVELHIDVQMVEETLSRTNLGALEVGDFVNLERAMPASGRFDGHVVQGHIDGVGTLVAEVTEDDSRRMTIRLPEGLDRYVVEKGSITVDGVSLTVASVAGDEIEIALIPHTLDMTTLGLRNIGDTVNLEVDVLAKYVERILKADQ